MKELFGAITSEAALLVYASNAFNCINRQASSQHNISKLCPSLFTIPTKHLKHLSCSSSSFLLLVKISSTEGTTQSDPLAMGIHALVVIPLICRLRNEVPGISQIWFADDASNVG